MRPLKSGHFTLKCFVSDLSAGGDETRGPGRRLVLGLPAPLAAPVPLDASARTSSPAGRPREHSWPLPYCFLQAPQAMTGI